MRKMFILQVLVSLLVFSLPLLARGETFQVSPHTEVLQLVWQTQGDVIKSVDKEETWSNTKERAWLVHRIEYSTDPNNKHVFFVVYRIGTEIVATWSVDLLTKKVVRVLDE